MDDSFHFEDGVQCELCHGPGSEYIEADITMKEAALKRMDAPSSQPVRFKATDRLLAFLEAL